MTKEQIKKLEELCASVSPEPKILTATEKARNLIDRELRRADRDLDDLKTEYRYKLKMFENQQSKAFCASEIIRGKEGFVKVPQFYLEKYEIRCGFSCFEEYADMMCNDYFQVFLSELPCHFGEVVFKVDGRGMMTIIKHIVDSSD